MAAWSGVPTVIADAKEPEVVARAVSGEEIGTWIDPHPTALPARKLWIAFGQPSEGRLTVDTGAAAALVKGGKSLLAVGVTEVGGSFDQGAAVEVHATDGALVAKGLVEFNSQDLNEMAGKASSGAGGLVIHRDHLVVLVGR
jgi:glutamate 5-kinase